MKPRDLFNLAIRILGLTFVYHGLTALPLTVSEIIAALMSRQVASFIFTLLMAIWPLAVAYWLLRGAPLIMRIAYPDTAAPSPQETGEVGGHKMDA